MYSLLSLWFSILCCFFTTFSTVSGQYANLTIRFEPEVLRPESTEGFLVKCTESVNPTPKEYMVTFYLNDTVLVAFTINPTQDRFSVDVHSNPALNVYPTRESLYEIRVRPNDPIETLGTFQCSLTCTSINFPHPLTFYSNLIDTRSTLARSAAVIPKANVRLDVSKVDSNEALVKCHVHLEPPHLHQRVIFLMDNTPQAEYTIKYSKKKPIVIWKRLVDPDSYNIFRGNSTLFSDTDYQLSMLFSSNTFAGEGNPRMWWKCQLVVTPFEGAQDESAKFYSAGVDFKF